MSVIWRLIRVTLMPHVLILMVATSVPVTQDSVEMGTHAVILMSVSLILVTRMQLVPIPMAASRVSATLDLREMEQFVYVSYC